MILFKEEVGLRKPGFAQKIGMFLALGFIICVSGCNIIEARQVAREGNQAYTDSDYRTAIAKYHEAIALDPETPNLYLNLGYSYFSIYEPTSRDPASKSAAIKAVDAFEQHLLRYPDDEGASLFQIKTLLKAAPSDPRMAEKAKQTFLRMLEQNPKDHEARQYLITLFVDCQRYRDAVDFFKPELVNNPQDIETMKILAIIADKSRRTQDAIDWYWQRAQSIQDPQKRAMLFYEVGTYTWNTLHYQSERHLGAKAIIIADQGIEACLRAMALKKRYAEAMIYANLLYLKRALFEPTEHGRSFSENKAYEFRVKAGKILQARKASQTKHGMEK